MRYVASSRCHDPTYLTKDDIARRREELLAAGGLSVDEPGDRQPAYQLSPEQILILKDLEDPDFLTTA